LNVRILVLGVGAQGSVIARFLSEAPEVSEVVCGDMNLERMNRLKSKLKSEKITFRKADALKREDLTSLMKKIDLVINALPGFNLKVMGVALESGSHYIDLGSDYPVVESISEQLKLNDKWRDAGLAAVITMGQTPGVTNVMAKYICDQLDHVERIHVRCGWRDIPEELIVKPWTPGWSPEIALLDYATEPIIFEDGKFKKVPVFSGIKRYKFPNPVGWNTIGWHLHEEPVTLPKFIAKGLKHVGFEYPVDTTAGAFIGMGFTSRDPIEVKGAKVAPLDVFLKLAPAADQTIEEADRLTQSGEFGRMWCLMVEVVGKRRGKEVSQHMYTIYDSREIFRRFSTINVDVALPATTAAMMIARRDLNVAGVMAPECLPPEPILTNLSKKGMRFHEKIVRVL